MSAEPSKAARRAAGVICESASNLAISHDSPDPDYVAEIIERLGRIEKIARELDANDWKGGRRSFVGFLQTIAMEDHAP